MGDDPSVAAPLLGLATLALDEGRTDDAADAVCQATWLLRWWHGRDDPTVTHLQAEVDSLLQAPPVHHTPITQPIEGVDC